jgi:GTP-binding protein
LIDTARIRVVGGRGGSGCVAFRREKHVPRGGPSGGDGGDGGAVFLVVDPRKRTLLDFQYRKKFAAEAGEHGMGKERDGAMGRDVEIAVPPGTIVKDATTGEVIGDLVEAGQRLKIAGGGKGGRGNRRFQTATNRAPRDWEPGGLGESREVLLELRLLADAGLVGLPNAGKSTLLSRVSAARPKIADYPFTTLEPYLGVVRVGEFDSFVLADIPGIIEGASRGKGLGLDFLRHIERTAALVFVIDASLPEPAATLATLRRELIAHDELLASRPALVALNKVDLLDAGARTALPEALAGLRALPISAATGEGIEEVVRAVRDLLPGPGAGDDRGPARDAGDVS